ncbi:MAG: MBL fold metallo-hydrolase [Cyclobacteriaceae bacterium]
MRRFTKIFTWTVIFVLILGIGLAAFTYFYMGKAKFGKAPSGARLELIKKSPQYKNGQFENTEHTPTLTDGYSMMGILYDQVFKSHPNRKPKAPLPHVQTDLKNLPADKNVLVWFGHSSYFMQIGGVRFLVDPVFSGNASPVPRSVVAFEGTNTYGVDDLPDIDYLLISHDHYDHLDYKTIKKLKEKTGKVICGLGVGSHFEKWGYPAEQLIEADWYDSMLLQAGYTVHATPSRHFSGRGVKRNNTLWMSYVLETPDLKIYIGGDSGYGAHFAEIGETYGPVDLAILENGQYNLAWEAIHLLPEQLLQAAKDLKAKRAFPVHNAKFVLAMHPWDEPLREVTRLNDTNIPLVTPKIGQVVELDDPDQKFEAWWF